MHIDIMVKSLKFVRSILRFTVGIRYNEKKIYHYYKEKECCYGFY